MEEKDLSLDNILTDEDIQNLFIDDDNPEENDTTEGSDNNDNKETTEVDVENLFTEPESVGSKKNNNREKEETPSDTEDETSPNFYSSITKALVEEGIFPDLDDDTINGIKEPEDFRDLIEQQINAGIEESNKRVLDALNAGLKPSEIQSYENAISYLNSIDDDAIENEDEKGEELRKNLIYQDLINRGFSKERATREVEKSFKAGSDIDDAKEALKGNKEFFENQYNSLIKKAKDEEAKEVERQKKQAEELKKSILNDKKIFGDMELDSNTRKRIYDNISKPVYKDEKTGKYLTAVQKYQKENPTEFTKNLGLLFTLTDGFTNIDKLVQGKVKKEVKKGLRELERTINNTSRTSDGDIRFANGGFGGSSISSNFTIDI